MFRTKRSLILGLTFVLLLSLIAACSNGNTGNTGNTGSTGNSGNASSGANTGSEDGMDTSEFVTISYIMMGDRPTNGQLEAVMERVNAILKEKVNAHLELRWVEWADWATKYNLLMASGEPLDLITAGGWLDLWGNAAKGAFKPLDELLPVYAPLTWAEITPEEWDMTRFDGQIVSIPENNYTQWVNHGMFYRTDWAREFGITEQIMDFPTMQRYLQGIKDNKPDVIPWDTTAVNDLYYGYVGSFTNNIDIGITTGFFNAFYANSIDDKYTVVSPLFDDAFVEFATMMKDWADRGFWREDVLNFTGDTRTAFKAGLTGLDAHHTQTFATLRTQMDDEQPGSEIMMFPYGVANGNLIATSITHGATALGTHSRNPERALMVYELLRQDEEIYRLFNYGIEGVQYEIVDGKRVQPEGYEQARDEFYSNFWGGRVDRFEIPSDQTWDGIDELYALYEGVAQPYPYGQFVFDRTPIEAELTAIAQVTGQLGPALLYGKVADPAQAVEDLRNRLLAAGYEKALAEVQRQMDEFRAMVE